MSKHLLLVSIGPIQDFIASARKAQDLWFGSWLLSDLSRAVARSLGKQVVVFPASQSDDAPVANKILAVVDNDPKEFANAGRTALAARLDALMAALFDRAQNRAGNLKTHFNRAVAEQQVRDLIELVWVAVPFADDAAYAAARNRAEELLAARKNTRDWAPVTWGGPVPKSALDGQRESVLHENLYSAIKANPATGEQARRAFGIRPTERLCGVGLLKRLGQEVDIDGEATQRQVFPPGRPRFHSTSHSAALTLRQHFDDAGVRQAWGDYLIALGANDALGNALERFRFPPGARKRDEVTTLEGYDGALLFEERVRVALEERMPKEQAKTKLRDLKRKLDAVLERTGHPPAYYALLLADGDRMGAAIDNQTTLEAHQALSTALDEFATNVDDIVRSHDGSLIYAGGDDVLALLPLNTVVDCARKLANDFATRLEKFENAQGQKPTLSVGVAVAHHLANFGLVRQQAKRAEAAAKVERNSLAISVDKRSGGETIITGSWTKAALLPLDARLQKWMSLFKDNQLPRGVIAELRELASGGHKAEVLTSEARRIIARKQPDKGAAAKLRDDVRDALQTRATKDGLRALADELYVALELQRTREAAQPKKAKSSSSSSSSAGSTP